MTDAAIERQRSYRSRRAQRERAVFVANLTGWAIVDLVTGRPYLDIGFTSELAAERERACLLKGFPESHPWRARLAVLPIV